MFGGYILIALFSQSLEEYMLHPLQFHYQMVCSNKAKVLQNSIKGRASICQEAQKQSHYIFCGSGNSPSYSHSPRAVRLAFTMKGGNRYLTTGSTGLVFGFGDNLTCHVDLGSMGSWTLNIVQVTLVDWFCHIDATVVGPL